MMLGFFIKRHCFGLFNINIFVTGGDSGYDFKIYGIKICIMEG